MLEPQGGESVELYGGHTVHLPPPGVVYNRMTGEMDEVEIISRSNDPEDQYWERIELPDWFEDEYEDMVYIQENEDPNHVNPRVQEVIDMHWYWRLNGLWFMNNGTPTYITGAHFFYLNWCDIGAPTDGGYPIYFDPNRKFWYFRRLCELDSNCLGYMFIGPRGTGKSSEEVAAILEDMTRVPHRRQAAIQSKSKDDAKDKIFKEKMVPMFNRLPGFFKPVFDHGTNPENKLSFFRPAKRGKGSRKVKYNREQELQNVVYPVSAKEKALDGGTYANIFQDEIGKTNPREEADVNVRMQVNRNCVYRFNRKIGMIRATTTVEEMDVGGNECHKVWNNSDPTKKTANGTTISGLYRYFISKFETSTNFMDKYGRIDKDAVHKYEMNERKAREGDPSELNSYIRKNPLWDHEPWRVNEKDSHFDVVALANQIEYCEITPNLYTRGNLIWKNGFGSDVEFVESSNGRWYMHDSLHDRPELTNNVSRHGDMIWPKNNHRFASGLDPYDNIYTTSDEVSNAASHVMEKYSPSHGKPVPILISEYVERPREGPLAVYEDMAKQCIYFGISILVEKQRQGVMDFFGRKGLGPMLMTLPGETQPGLNAPNSVAGKQNLVETLETYLVKYVEYINFIRTLKSLIRFDVHNTQEFDEAMSLYITIVAANNKLYNKEKKRKNTSNDIKNYYRFRKVKRN